MSLGSVLHLLRIFALGRTERLNALKPSITETSAPRRMDFLMSGFSVRQKTTSAHVGDTKRGSSQGWYVSAVVWR